MKNLKFYLVTAIIIVSTVVIQAQENCKVLVPELTGTYVGKCKKGLANGKGKAVGTDTYEGSFKKGLPNGGGVYTWANGDVYDGRWVYGVRQGEGVYKFKYQGKDSIQKGIWEENIYKGPKPKKPLVSQKISVTRYNFRREGDGDRILIDLTLNGSPNRDILDLSLISSSGSNFESGRSIGVESVNFPVLIKIKYLTWNTAHTSRHTALFEFEIFEPGKWQVDIVN